MGNVCCLKPRDKENLNTSPRPTTIRSRKLTNPVVLESLNTFEGNTQQTPSPQKKLTSILTKLSTLTNDKIDQLTKGKDIDTSHNKNKYYLILEISHIDIFQRCDNFNKRFKPYLEIGILGNDIIRIYPQDEIANSSNISNISDNVTTNTQSSIISARYKATYFKTMKIFEVPIEFWKSNMMIYFKNEVSQGQMEIIIGEAKIPLIQLHTLSKFEGVIELKLKGSSVIGILRLNTSILESLVTVTDYKKSEIDESIKLVLCPHIIHSEEMSERILQSIFKKQHDSECYELNSSKKIPRKYTRSEIDRDVLHGYFVEFCKVQNNLIGLYQLLILMVQICIKEDMIIIHNFFKKLKIDEKNEFHNILNKFINNPYIIKLYIIVIFHYHRYFSNNKVIYHKSDSIYSQRQRYK
jgi:hypothetical protein